MRILIITKVFLPSVGGMEKYAYMMAETFHRLGHNVIVLTEECGEYNDYCSFKIVRTKRFFKDIIYYARKSDVNIISGFSLKYLPFSILNRKNLLVYHNSSFGNDWQSHIKLIISRLKIPNIVNVVVSNFVGKSLKLPCFKTIYNPYENDVFRIEEKISCRKGFVFVGRICESKGVELLIQAFLNLSKLNPDNKDLKLDIIGDGPLKTKLEYEIAEEYPNSNITFKGMLSGESLNKELNSHKFHVVPSVYGEAFGIVALEGMAAGCIEICSDSDGLQEAIGDNGFLFKKGDVNDLMSCMEQALGLSDAEFIDLQRKGLEWTKNFTMDNVCNNYLKIMI